MFRLGQSIIGLAQLVKMLLSLNLVLGLLLFGALVHSTPAHLGSGSVVDSSEHLVFQSSYTVLTDSLDDGPKKQAYEIRPIIPPFLYKFHFIFALAMFFFIALITVSEDLIERALLLLPVVLCYGISHILFACDQAEMLEGMMERYKRRISKPVPGM